MDGQKQYTENFERMINHNHLSFCTYDVKKTAI